MNALRIGPCNSPEELLLEVERLIESVGLEMYTIASHQYHFIIELFCDGEAIGRLKIHYNKFYICEKVGITHPLKAIYFEKVSSVLPIMKKNVLQADDFSEFFQINYRYRVEIIHSCETFTCYEIKHNQFGKEVFVWMKICKGGESPCEYVSGDTDFYDELAYIYEKDLREA